MLLENKLEEPSALFPYTVGGMRSLCQGKFCYGGKFRETKKFSWAENEI
jgi:hypothetical protein